MGGLSYLDAIYIYFLPSDEGLTDPLVRKLINLSSRLKRTLLVIDAISHFVLFEFDR